MSGSELRTQYSSPPLTPQRRMKMKKYTPRAAKVLMIAALTCGAVLLIGMIFVFASIGNIGLSLGLILLGGLLGILFFTCFLAENSRALIIDTDKVIFPRGAEKNGITVFQRTIVRICDISSVESQLRKGDKLVSGDCFFYTLRLKDGTSITVTLYAYGKEIEKEILETIKSGLA